LAGNVSVHRYHEWLIRFVEHRVGDRRVIRLIRKWLKAGVMEDGEVTRPEVGTPQGGVATPRTQKVTSALIA
jgi:RNA-directed DNA polymerase